MLSALNTGGYDIQDSETATEMTDRALTMLSQYLISNQSLQLNSTFKIYLKILSLEHMQSVPPRKNRKRKFGRIHVGSPLISKSSYNPKWAFEIPLSDFNHEQIFFLNEKCLLICTILGLLQNLFFQSNSVDTRFLLLSKLRSKFKKQRDLAFVLLKKELEELFSVVKIQKTGPYELKSTIKLLHKAYKCSFFVFNGTFNSTKLFFSYPDDYDDSLIPIFLFKPNFEPHVIFICNLNYYFGSNFTTCLACKRSFKTNYNQHICKNKECCFSCRKHLQSHQTFIHKILEKNFCDKNLSTEDIVHCQICNLPLYSVRCQINHRKICNGKGKFGYYCLDCKKFIAGKDSALLKSKHICTDSPMCKFCFQPRNLDHLCQLKRARFPQGNPRLAFLTMDFFASDNDAILMDQIPCIASVLREETRSNFQKYLFKNNELHCANVFSDSVTIDYLPHSLENAQFEKKDLKRNGLLSNKIRHFKSKFKDDCLSKLLRFILDPDYSCTTYICQDTDSLVFMTILKGLVDIGICPNVVRKGKNILLLEVPELSIRLLNYLEVNMKLPKCMTFLVQIKYFSH